MNEIEMAEGIFDASTDEVLCFPTDTISLRVISGDVQVAEYVSDDRDGPPVHRHPWHEVEYVIEGNVEFWLHDRWIPAAPGAVQMLPAGVGHSVRVPAGEARLLMVTIGAPYDGFARELSALHVTGTMSPESVVAVAHRHGVHLAETE
jgi:quercetin dioxygenase-like cupin family protein